MFNPQNWNWAMYAYMVLTLVGLGMSFARHGEMKIGRENAWTTIIATALSLGLLYFAGAFA